MNNRSVISTACLIMLAGCGAGNDNLENSHATVQLASSVAVQQGANLRINGGNDVDMSDINIKFVNGGNGTGTLYFLQTENSDRPRATVVKSISDFNKTLANSIRNKSYVWKNTSKLMAADGDGAVCSDEDCVLDSGGGDSGGGDVAGYDSPGSEYKCDYTGPIVVCTIRVPNPGAEPELPAGPDDRPWYCRWFGIGCNSAPTPDDEPNPPGPPPFEAPPPVKDPPIVYGPNYESDMQACMEKYEQDMEECSAYYGVFGKKTWITCKERAARYLSDCQTDARNNNKP